MTACSEPTSERASDVVPGADGAGTADFERLFGLSLDMLAIASLGEGHWHRVNPAMTRILGWSERELLANPIAALVHPDDREHSRHGMTRLAAGESLTQFEHRLRCKDGSYRWIAWNTRSVPQEGLLYCAGRDITEGRIVDAALRESESRYRSLVNASEAGFCIIEMKIEPGKRPDFRFLEVSDDFERLTSLANVAGRWMRELRTNHEESWFDFFAAVALTGRPAHFQHCAREFDHRWFDVHAFPVDAPEQRRVGVLFNDITERRRTEEALASELDAMTRLHELSRHVTQCGDLQSLLEAILDATIALHGAQFGSIHLYEPGTQHLRSVAQRGFEASFLTRFGATFTDAGSPCGEALARRERLTIEDIDREPRYAPCLMAARHGGFRAMQATPLFTSSGEPLGLLSTYFREPHRLSERDHKLTDLYGRQACDAIARHLLEQTLRGSEERLRLAVDVGRLATWDWNIRSGEVAWSDDHFLLQGYPIGGVRPSYEAWAQRIHPEDRAGAEAAVARARDTRTDYARVFRMQHPDGIVKWCSARGRFFYDQSNQPVRMIGVMIDITARREWEERQKLLIAELQHRTRNLIAVVQSIAHQTLGECDSLGLFRGRFDDRLSALSRVQGLLARSDQRRITIGDLLQMEFAAFGSEATRQRIMLEGPEVALPDQMVQTLALALHELATNARKYGALAEDGGALQVVWKIASDARGHPRLCLDWLESGLSPAAQPGAEAARRGFGRELIERGLPYQLHAETRYEIAPTHVHCSICVPVPHGAMENRHAH